MRSRNQGLKRKMAFASILLATVLSSGAAAATTGQVSSATSKDWTVRVWVAATTVKAGTDIPATITIVNHSGHAILGGSCPDAAYLMNVGNAKIPNNIVVPTPSCKATHFSRGTYVFHLKVWTIYEVCSGSSQSQHLPRCPKNGHGAPLPSGTYRTNVVLPKFKGLPTPKPITIRLTA
jgi:hypothetical protein